MTIEEDPAATSPLPKPLQSGFSHGFAYLVFGAFSLSESGEAHFILANDRDDIWFISGAQEFRLLLDREASGAGRNGHAKLPGKVRT